MTFKTMERDVGFHNLFHSLLNTGNIIQSGLVPYLQVAIISFGYGMFKHDFSIRV